MTPAENAEHLTRLYGHADGTVSIRCTCGWEYRWHSAVQAPQVPEIQQARADHFAELFMGSLERARTRPRPALAPAPEGFVQGRDDPSDRP